jgi:hypothetical protein
MVSWSLAVVVAAVLAADLPPEALIERLGSADRVVREEAARTLEEQGPDVLPALHAARGTVESPEARGRLAGVIARVETRMLDRPTLVALDFEDRPLGEAIEALAARSGFSLALDDPALASRRVTAHAPAPLPFWEALDRLGRAGHVHHDPGPLRNAVGNDPQAAAIRLVDGDPPVFTTYPGSLRVHLFATHWHRDINFAPAADPRAQPYRTTVAVEFQAFAEPGRFLDLAGAPRMEAVDAQGKALAPPPGDGDRPNPAERSWLIPGRLSVLQWQVPLGLSDPSRRMPLRLRGVLPVVISVRRPGPLVIPLADAAGKTFRQDGGVVRVEQGPSPNRRPASLMLVLSDDPPEADRGRESWGPQPDRISELVRNRLEFEDAEGHPLNWMLLGRPLSDPSGQLRVQIHFTGSAPPSRLRVYRLYRLATEVPLAFENAPAP